MINLPSLTLAAIDGVGNKTEEHVEIFNKCSEGIVYGDKVLVTADPEIGDLEGIRVCKIDKMDYQEFNVTLGTKMINYIETDQMLMVQEDGYVLNADAWRDEFLHYDYLATPWLEEDWSLNNLCQGSKDHAVGGGGFSLRSRRFLEEAAKLPYDKNMASIVNEDVFMCNTRFARNHLESKGMRYAPLDLAVYFGLGLSNIVEIFEKGYIKREEMFGFHGYTALDGYLSCEAVL